MNLRKIKLLTKEELQSEHITVLRALAKFIGVKAPTGLNKDTLIQSIIDLQEGKTAPVKDSKLGAPAKDIDISKFYVTDEELIYSRYFKPVDATITLCDVAGGYDFFETDGFIDVMDAGYGFVRVKNYFNDYKDVYVPSQIIKEYGLVSGDYLVCSAKVEKQNEAPAIYEIHTINDLKPSDFLSLKRFDNLSADYPTEKIVLSQGENRSKSLRVIDLIAPIGKGQRGLIVAPPKTGKTTLLKEIATTIAYNYCDAKVFVLLLDERPEEVTDFKDNVPCEVIASTFDERPEHHIKTAEKVLNRAKRLVEQDKDVIILMDSITRLARAYNATVTSSGKTLSGGLDAQALTFPKRFFGAARNVKKGGSLTIIATALIDTGSRLDDVIYEEFKGTGNMELFLSRDLSEKRVFPAVNLNKSGTRKEEKLFNESELDGIYNLRRFLYDKKDAMEILLEMVNKSKDNQELLEKLDGWKQIYGKSNEIK